MKYNIICLTVHACHFWALIFVFATLYYREIVVLFVSCSAREVLSFQVTFRSAQWKANFIGSAFI